MKKYFLMVFYLVLVGTGESVAADARVVKIGVEGAYPPWITTLPDGSVQGFEPSLAGYVCEKLSLNCQFVALDFDSMIPSLHAKKIDVILDALTITEERKKVIAFTDAYAMTLSSFVSRSDSEYANAPGSGLAVEVNSSQGSEFAELRAKFKGAILGIQAGTIYPAFVQAVFADALSVREYKSAADRDLDLQTGRIDLGLDDAITLASSIDSSEGALEFTGPKIGGAIWGQGIAMGVRKEDSELNALLSGSIREALADKSLQKLSTLWFKSMSHRNTSIHPGYQLTRSKFTAEFELCCSSWKSGP